MLALKNSGVEEEMRTHARKHAHTHEEIRRSQQNKEESAAKCHSSEERVAS